MKLMSHERAVLLALALALTLCAQSVVVRAAPPPKTFRDFFDGVWEVEIRPFASLNDSVTRGSYVMSKMEDKIMGIYYENVTTGVDNETGLAVHEVQNQLRVRVELDSPTQGEFRTARAQTDIFSEPESEEPSLKFKTLFAFDFQIHRNKIWVSAGEWLGKQKGTYQFVITSPQSFLLTVTPAAGNKQGGHTISGYKRVSHSMWDSLGPVSICFVGLVGAKLIRNMGNTAANRRKMAARLPPSAQSAQPAAAAAGKKSQ